MNINNLVVVNKNNGKIYELFDITYDNAGYPHFLVYKGGQWVRMSAKHFRPYTEDDYEKEFEKHDITTLNFGNYSC